MRKARKKLSDKQKKAVMYWSGYEDEKKGDWIEIVNEFMERDEVPFAKRVLVRSHLAMAISNGMIASDEAKKLYASKRPSELDDSIQTLIPNPKSCSYPSSHAVEAAIAQKILTYYFPEDEARWKEIAQEEADSRIWAGVHFPIDRDAGLQLGNHLATEFINCLDEEPSEEKCALLISTH